MPEKLKEEVAERRKFMRLNVTCAIDYKLLNVAPPRAGKTRAKNISVGGICLIIEERLSPGSILELNFHLPDEKTTIVAKGKVAWVRPFKIATEEEHFDCGIEFTEISEADRKRIERYVFTYK